MSYYDRELGVLSYSIGKHLDISPHAYRAWIDAPEKNTDALRFGRAFDAAILTPDEFDMEFVVAEKCDRRTTAGKQRWQELATEYAGKTLLSEDLMEQIQRMRDSLYLPAHSHCPPALVGRKQADFHWEDSLTGVRCKARLDVLGDGYISDLKTTTGPPLARTWRREVSKWGYDMQAAWYFRACEEHGIFPEVFQWVCAEKESPYHWAVHYVTREGVEHLQERVDSQMQRMRVCMENDTWPSIETEEIEIWK